MNWIRAQALDAMSTDGGTTIDLKPAFKSMKEKPAARPALVFVYDRTMKRRAVRKLGQKMFRNEKLGMASDFFHVVQVPSSESLPVGLHVTDAHGKVVAVTQVKDKTKDVFHAIATGFSSHYEGTMKAAVARYGDYLDKLQAAEDEANLNQSADTMNAFQKIQKKAKKVASPKVKKPSMK